MLKEKKLEEIKKIARNMLDMRRNEAPSPKQFQNWKRYVQDKLHDAMKRQKIHVTYDLEELEEQSLEMFNEMLVWLRERGAEFLKLDEQQIWEKFNNQVFHKAMIAITAMYEQQHGKRIDSEGEIVQYEKEDTIGKYEAKLVGPKKNILIRVKEHIEGKDLPFFNGSYSAQPARGQFADEVKEIFFPKYKEDWFEIIRKEYGEVPVVVRWQDLMLLDRPLAYAD